MGREAIGSIRDALRSPPMDLYARINILEGRAVRLGRGSLEDVTSLDADPLNRARGWIAMGIDYLLVVDLDAAAYGSYRNRPLIDRMLEALEIPVVVAGGIRSDREAARLIERGAWKVTMGTAAIEHTNMVWDLCRDYQGRVIVSLDVLDNEELVTRGWTSDSGPVPRRGDGGDGVVRGERLLRHRRQAGRAERAPPTSRSCGRRSSTWTSRSSLRAGCETSTTYGCSPPSKWTGAHWPAWWWAAKLPKAVSLSARPSPPSAGPRRRPPACGR